MRKLPIILLVLLIGLALFAEEKKAKVAVMEIEDRSATLDAAMLGNAAEYLRGELAATNRFVLISKDRQRQIILKEEKKESWKDCYDQNCRVQLGQALSADTLLQSSVNLFGGIYTLTVEMVDLAKEATVKGAKAKFDGTEAGLMRALDKIMLQIAGRTVKYDPGTVSATAVKGVDIGSVTLSALPDVKVAEAQFQSADSLFSMTPVTPEVVVADVDTDVLVAYDNALKMDKMGKDIPIKALLAWKELVRLTKNNPYLDLAKTRVAQWTQYMNSLELAERYKKAVSFDKYGRFFPDKVIDRWQSLAKAAQGTPYLETARERIAAWKEFIAKVDTYRKQQTLFAKQHGDDIAKLRKLLKLDLFTEPQKRAMLIRYLEAYAPFYGMEDIDQIIDRLGDLKLEKRMRELIFNALLAKEMDEKCAGGNTAACYIHGSLKEVDDLKAAHTYFDTACKNGIVNACITMGNAKYEENNPEAAEYFSIACSWESPQGCNYIAYLAEIGFGIDRSVSLATALYKKACDMGQERSCVMHKNITASGFSSDQAAAIVQKKNIDAKIDAAVGTDGNDIAAAVEQKKISDLRQTTRTVKAEETYYPYMWPGIGTIIGGVVLAVAGGAGFGVAAKNKLDDYNTKMLPANIQAAIASGMTQDQYTKDARKLWDDAQTFAALEYTFIAVGCAAVAGGIVLAVWPGKREVVKELSFMPVPGGFVVAAGFEF